MVIWRNYLPDGRELEEFGGDLGLGVKTQEVERVTGKKGVGWGEG